MMRAGVSQARGAFGRPLAGLLWQDIGDGIVPEQQVVVLRAALARADVVAERLLVAARDHLDRTARLFQATTTLLVAVSAAAGLLVEVGFVFPWLAALLVQFGLATELIALVFYAVAYSSLPADPGMSFGTDPLVLARRTLDSGMDERAWLVAELRAVAGQLVKNGYVIAVLVRRRHAGVWWMTLGLAAFLGSISYIAAVEMWGR